MPRVKTKRVLLAPTIQAVYLVNSHYKISHNQCTVRFIKHDIRGLHRVHLGVYEKNNNHI